MLVSILLNFILESQWVPVNYLFTGLLPLYQVGIVVPALDAVAGPFTSLSGSETFTVELEAHRFLTVAAEFGA